MLLILGAIYLRHWLKARSRTKLFEAAPDRPMSMLATPLIPSETGFTRPLPVSSRKAAPPPRPALVTHYTGVSEQDSSSLYSHSSYSPYSPNPESFHFPILSADGHLLPPPPVSSHRSLGSQDDSGARPLPTAPPVLSAIIAPVPVTPQRWSYRASSLSPDEEEGDVIGLYSGIEIRGDGSIEMLRDDYDVEPRGIAASPTIARVHKPIGVFEPHRATFYRSLSAEGEDLDQLERSTSGHGRRHH